MKTASYSRTLTGREREVLGLIWEGKTRQRIANELCISTRTLGNHVANIFVKLGARTMLDAIREGLQAGIIRAPQQHQHSVIHYCVECNQQVTDVVMSHASEGGDAKPK